MKRTRNVTLVLMGLGATGLGGCGEEPKQEVFVFQNPKQCVEEKRGTDADCSAAFIRAQGEHLDKAPKYEAKADCERDFGADKCEERKEGGSSRVSSGGSYYGGGGGRSSFAPLMAGYLMGRAGQSTSPQPLYQFRGQTDYRTPAGGAIPGLVNGRPTGARTVAPSNLVTASRPTTVSRGGFGATAMAASHSSAS